MENGLLGAHAMSKALWSGESGWPSLAAYPLVGERDGCVFWGLGKKVLDFPEGRSQ
jgi:hypothetical protein